MSQAIWYRSLDEPTRESMRGYGRQIMETLQRYLTIPSQTILAEARSLGSKYGQILRNQHMNLNLAGQGFLTYQDFVLESVISVTEMAHHSADWSQAMRSVFHFTREILIGLLEAYSA